MEWTRTLGGAFFCLLLAGCGTKERMVTVTFPDADGNTDQWVCDRRGGNCEGRREQLVDDAYRPELDVLLPLEKSGKCPNGPAKMEILIRDDAVVAVGYECAAPREPTGLPTEGASLANGGGLPPEGSGLPPEPPETTPNDAETAK
jgi:hypothetical protein